MFVNPLCTQIVAVQQHYVKPSSQDYTDNVLSEECKQLTGLNEEHIKNAQPLEQVLDEVSKFISMLGRINPKKS